jgi:two-component system nitrogen regulation response regulator NtrX
VAMSLVLIVDDVGSMREQYAYDLKRLGKFEILTASRGEEALELLKKEPVDCMILDLEMPGLDGFGVLKEMHSASIRVPVVVYTGTGSYERCVRAIRLGAYSFLDKSESMEKVVQEINNAMEKGRLQGEVEDLRSRLGEEDELIGESPAMERLRDEIRRVAPIPSPVLIIGESGTGKELVARAIHRLSGRKGQFFPINCGALPENLVESELFGYEAGAFTGAGRTRKGAFEAAGSGSLFLDEIGELPPPAQAKLLRVLEDRKVLRLGGTKGVPVDARVLAATNRDLEQESSGERFREDLYYRINVHQIAVPPLRERLSDVPLLVDHFMTLICKRFGIRKKTVEPEAVERLAGYGWERNNVRELRNILERMIIATDGPVIEAEDIPTEIFDKRGRRRPTLGAGKGLKDLKAEAEREILLAALERNQWQIGKTASELGLADHSSLLKIMRRHDLKRPS